MDDKRKIELLVTLLEVMISNLGYPVGCGIAPHPETLKKMAENVLKVARSE